MTTYRSSSLRVEGLISSSQCHIHCSSCSPVMQMLILVGHDWKGLPEHDTAAYSCIQNFMLVSWQRYAHMWISKNFEEAWITWMLSNSSVMPAAAHGVGIRHPNAHAIARATHAYGRAHTQLLHKGLCHAGSRCARRDCHVQLVISTCLQDAHAVWVQAGLVAYCVHLYISHLPCTEQQRKILVLAGAPVHESTCICRLGGAAVG